MDIHKQASDSKMAVVFKNVNKSFEKGKIPVLKSFSMNVPKGLVYSLLGASACGKTTVLRIAVGLLKPHRGDVVVLGGNPGTKNSGVPGPRVGYMPQDSALVKEFTVSGALYYFGWLYGMTNKEIQDRYDFLAQLLELPPGGQMVNTLSGGQQRRLSFAAAVIHGPELLIMDEPTVGLDPILREKIWQYLLKLSIEDGVTILLTTHYIEEARQSHIIGLLRNGILLAETSPNHLLSKYSCDTLEEAFLLLSEIQAGQRQSIQHKCDKVQENPSTSSQLDTDLSPTIETRPIKKFENARHRSFRARMKSLLYKNILKTFRNRGGVLFNFVYTIVFMFTFYSAVGKDPTYLEVGVVNKELGDCHNLPEGIANYSGVQSSLDEYNELVCTLNGMSCLFIKELEGDTLVISYYETLEDGLEATRNGDTFATLLFSKNFTEAQQERYDDPAGASNSTLEHASVKIWLDMAEYTIGNTLKLHFQKKVVDLYKHIANDCGLPENANALPMKFQDPVYGKKDTNFSEFMAPGMIMALMYCLAVLMSSNEVVTERTEGLWNRNLVAGVTEFEIITSHLLAQLITMVVQLAEVFLFAIFVYDLQILGSVFASLLMVLVQAICGASMGILISVVNNDISQSMLMSMSSFLPYILLCGIAWPVEGMYPWLQTLTYMGPATWPITALRNIFTRGWPITHSQVYPGFIASVVWFILFSSLSILGLKVSKY